MNLYDHPSDGPATEATRRAVDLDPYVTGCYGDDLCTCAECAAAQRQRDDRERQLAAYTHPHPHEEP